MRQADDDRPWRPRIVRGDQAAGPGDELRPDKVLHTDADGRTERLATPEDGATAEQGSDTHFEAILDDEPSPEAGEPVYVDVVTHDHEQRPIIPAVLRKGNRIPAAKQVVGRTAYRVGYHGLRAPWYSALALWYAPRGLWRVGARLVRWAWDLGLEERAAREAGDVALALMKRVDSHRQRRLPVVFALLAVIAAALPVLVFLAPWWVQAVVGVGALPPLARLGRPVDRRIVQTAVVAARFRKITPDVVLRAYHSAGLGHPDKKGKEVTFASPMAAVGEDGCKVTVDLPYGMGFSDVVKAKESLASGLDVTEHQIYLTRDPSSTRRHELYVAYRNPLAIPAGRTPLLDCKPRNIWRPAPFGLDERNRLVEILMLWNSFLVGAQPRKGKTFSARLLALFAALDPYVKLTVVDGKASPDWQKFRLVAHRFVSGTVFNRDGDPVQMLLEALRELKAHIQQVNQFLSMLPVTECPDGKLTEELSRKYPNLRVWVLVMEEFQVYYELDDSEDSKEVASLLSFIMAVGPSAGVIILSSSQKPSGIGAGDIARLFNRFRDNHAVRFALKCGNRLVSEAVLGGDAYGEGYDASTLPTGKQFRGIGYLYNLTDETPTVRCHLADAADTEKVLIACRRHREQLGLLTGMAAGEDLAREQRDVLYDVQQVFNAGEGHVSWRVAAVRLRAQLPEHYADETQESISAKLRELGVPSVNVRDNETGDPVKGCKLDAVQQAVERRAITAGTGSGSGFGGRQ